MERIGCDKSRKGEGHGGRKRGKEIFIPPRSKTHPCSIGENRCNNDQGTTADDSRPGACKSE